MRKAVKWSRDSKMSNPYILYLTGVSSHNRSEAVTLSAVKSHVNLLIWLLILGNQSQHLTLDFKWSQIDQFYKKLEVKRHKIRLRPLTSCLGFMLYKILSALFSESFLDSMMASSNLEALFFSSRTRSIRVLPSGLMSFSISAVIMSKPLLSWVAIQFWFSWQGPGNIMWFSSLSIFLIYSPIYIMQH